jgi:hypothetical protein
MQTLNRERWQMSSYNRALISNCCSWTFLAKAFNSINGWQDAACETPRIAVECQCCILLPSKHNENTLTCFFSFAERCPWSKNEKKQYIFQQEIGHCSDKTIDISLNVFLLSLKFKKALFPFVHGLLFWLTAGFLFIPATTLSVNQNNMWKWAVVLR